MPIITNAITLSVVNDGAKGDTGATGATGKGVKSNTRYYCLQASATKPSKPTTNPPDSKWTKTEPSYTTGSTSYLYTVDLTVYTDSSFLYSDVSLSSSYEAAKAAYAKAVDAHTEITKTNKEVELKASAKEITETLKGYSTTAEMNAAITTKANEITSEVSKTYSKQRWHTAYGTDGTNGYIGFAEITITGNWANRPILFGLTNRGSIESNISLRFENTSGSDPSLYWVRETGGIGTWVIKTATSKWTVIAKKSEAYDAIYVDDFTNNNGNISVAWTDVHYNAIPNGAVESTKLVGSQAISTIATKSEVTQTADNIRSDVSKTLGNYSTTTQMNSAIDQKADSITQSVSETYTTKTDFNNLQIGGTNLLRGSRYPKYNVASESNFEVYSGISNYIDGDFGIISFPSVDTKSWRSFATSIMPIDIAYGKTFTFSFECQSDSYSDIYNSTDGKPIHITVAGCTATSSTRTKYVTIFGDNTESRHFFDSASWKKFSITFTVGSDVSWFNGGSGDVNRFYLQYFNYSIYPVNIRKCKLEYGDKATDWTPNVDDSGIGGHNLWVNTSKMRENNYFALISSSTDEWQISDFYNGPIYTRESFKAGDIITVQAKSNLPWSSVHGGSSTNKNKVGFWLLYGSYSKVSIGDWPEKQVFVPGDDSNTHFTKTVTVPSVDGVTNIYIGFRFDSYSDGSNVITAKLWDVKLERGNKATEWSPALNDGIKTTTVTIDANGMDVSTGGTINFHTNNFNVTPPAGNDQLFSVNAADRTVRAQRGYFDDYLYAPNMATKCESATIDIGVDGGLPSIQAAWDYLPEVCGIVKFRICGNAPGYAELKGKHVSFLIIESADTSQMYDVGTIWMWGVHGRASYVTISKNGTSSDDACRMYCSMFNFENVKFASAGRGLLLFNGSYAFLRWCSITGVGSVSKMAGHGLEAYSSSLNMYDCSGVAGGNGIYLASGSFAALKGNTFGPTHNTGGGVVVGSYTIDGTTYDAPTVSTSSTFSASTCATWQSTYGSTWKKLTDSVGKKVESRHSTTSSGFDYRAGWWVLDTGTAIKTALSGKTISKATVTIKRNDTNSDTRKCHLCYHSMTNTLMNGYDGAASGIGSITVYGIMTEIGSYNLNPSAETVITLPSSVYTKLQDGTIKGFGLVDNATDYKQIMCDNTCTLTVVYT